MDTKELDITAELAHIELSEEEKAGFAQAVSQLVEYFEIMDKLELKEGDVEHHIPLKTNALRSDNASESSLSDDILEQAPDLEDRFIAIPNVL
ncbi:Asp-tRNA(Asn)/Glu-tRNA(Gln) amidotransferase subunit GatC [Salinispira pacifica]|uniref:Glutamyl-tRNA(Gln) amidotransferase subunit C n=1 Tax=Salinispira pacifica TaxID=1307761 RepID=V5WMF2_9SPIO|nr:Asp-tRNA(Asn)/Glu-tRNA(Gln) amidotransferase subunit GatC [Salinispira pacifica]AHC16828.1 hypothetical protein L21SP2_3492 [Salinispira pacifica]